MEYKQTLNLPKTDFPIRVNSAALETEMLSFWQGKDVYKKIVESRAQNTERRFILHDGPPYANGHIHLGHAINRILKDIVVKSKLMNGLFAPFVPGWDCHGLPIETQLIKELGDKRHEISILEFRKKCHDYAMKFVGIQREESLKLGLFGDWFNPYLTLDPVYEEKIIEVFGKLANDGYIYRGLKPIHWCPTDQTALAEAEIEYEDHRAPSIYVKFQITNPKLQINSKIQNPNLNFDIPWFAVIWTTTPWTLPANVAIAGHPSYEYAFVLVNNEIWIMADSLVDSAMAKFEITDYKIIDKTKGATLEGVLAKHPFIDRDSILVLDEYVTLEAGTTGLVHIAPGHGIEDYKVGLNYKLPIVMPVDKKGHFDETVPEFIKGKHFDEANKLITQKLDETKHLIKLEFIKHSYPHCWRCKKPVIFRATEQWFVFVEHNDLRAKALSEVAKTNWIPSWGENRIRGMIETRPDWCISRQRSWGVPIPAFYCKKCGAVHYKGEFNNAAKKLVKEKGTDGWFEMSAEEILPKHLKCTCGARDFEKETDILDVWFESGSSHSAVLETRKELRWPADLYLEGSDQHRGWFQSSLLTSVGAKGAAPFKSVLTHGFTVDGQGKKMSKSLGNVVAPLDVIKKYGADVLRLWVASTDFRNDMAASDAILKQVQEAYVKIRNTCRFLLSNLSDYKSEIRIPNSETNSNDQIQKLEEADKWILMKLNKLTEKITKAYNDYEFHIVYHSLYDFCVSDLSAFYLDMSKDRLYCDKKDSKERKSAQFAIHEILLTLIKLMAPILSFTAEDLFRHLQMTNVKCQMSNGCSIFMLDMPKINPLFDNKSLEEKWEKLFEIRGKLYQVIEEARKNKEIASSTEAKAIITVPQKEYDLLKSSEDSLCMLFIVSEVELKLGEESYKVAHASGQKCDRCWQFKETVGKNAEHSTLCKRCAEAVS